MKLYIVTCYVEGCEECGNSYNVIGAFTSKEKAQACEKEHNARRHLHSPYTDIKEIELDAPGLKACALE